MTEITSNEETISFTLGLTAFLRPTGVVIAKNVKIRLRRSVLNYFVGLVQADGRTHGHENHLHFYLGRLLRDVSYDLTQ